MRRRILNQLILTLILLFCIILVGCYSFKNKAITPSTLNTDEKDSTIEKEKTEDYGELISLIEYDLKMKKVKSHNLYNESFIQEQNNNFIVEDEYDLNIFEEEYIEEITYHFDDEFLFESIEEEQNEFITEEEPITDDIYELGYSLYGISYLDTERSLKLITYEAYGWSPLSYYVACCCWTRATEDYWGYGNLYSAFGEADTSYDLWMDELGIADFAYDALYQCYMNPSYIRYCNGMAIPTEYIYYEDGIYVWN